MAEGLAQPHVIVRVATLEEAPGSRPAMHIGCSHDVPWLQDEENIPSYQEWQPRSAMSMVPNPAINTGALPRSWPSAGHLERHTPV